MKKLSIFILSLLVSVGLYAQNVPTYALVEISSDDQYEYKKFFYDENYNLTETEILYSDGIQAKEILHYNANHLVVKLDGYQVLNGAWQNTYYVDFEYDANGNKIKRTNYNNFGGTTFELGGIYHYYYDNNRRESWTLTMMGDIMEEGHYTYDSEGRILQEIAESNWSGTSEPSWKMDYNYNADGTLATVIDSYWEYNTWEVSSKDQYTYDAYKNCIKWEHLNNDVVVNKYEYEYNMAIEKSQLVLPVGPEDELEPVSKVGYNNQMVLSHWYTRTDDNILTYICDYIYDYLQVETVGIGEQVFQRPEMTLYPNVTDQQINILTEGNSIRNLVVVDMNGKVVMRKTNLNSSFIQLDVSHLTPGPYILQGSTARGTVSKKFIVK